MLLGASETRLYDAIMLVKEETPVMFFLDAHWGDNCPLLKELDIIAETRRFKNDVIAIHDFKVPNRPELGYDSYQGKDFELSYVADALDKIFGANNWTHFYNPTESEGAKRGILFAHKK
jgi:hypothetical protein